MIYKILQVVPKYPRTAFAQNKRFYAKNVFLGGTSLYKNLDNN